MYQTSNQANMSIKEPNIQSVKYVHQRTKHPVSQVCLSHDSVHRLRSPIILVSIALRHAAPRSPSTNQSKDNINLDKENNPSCRIQTGSVPLQAVGNIYTYTSHLLHNLRRLALARDSLSAST